MEIRLLFILLLSTAQSGLAFTGEAAVCNAASVCSGAEFGDEFTSCVCSEAAATTTQDLLDPSIIYIGGLMDLGSYTWCKDIFDFTVEKINERQLWPDALPAPFVLKHDLKDSRCDESTAVQQYWALRTENGLQPPHGIIGARCSGASTSLARISGLEAVPQLSPSSNSAKLTSGEFPFFSRLVAPNDERGEVGAVVALLRSFEWDTVNTLVTDTQFAKDFVTEFQKKWVGVHNDESGNWFGNIAYSDQIRLTENDEVDPESIEQALGSLKQGNSRVILLVAHNQHAFEILEQAYAAKFNPETIFVGPSAWLGREPRAYNLPPIPGYIGVAPFQNRDSNYQEFLIGYNVWRTQRGQSALSALPAFAAETVDAIRAMTTAISQTFSKRDGVAVIKTLRALDLDDGISGRVRFTTEGDRLEPAYTVINAKRTRGDGSIVWQPVGTLGANIGTFERNAEALCFAAIGCEYREMPRDSYPEPPIRLPIWATIIIVILLLLFVVFAFKYWRSHMKKVTIKAELDTFRNSIVGMRAAERDHVPKISRGDIESGVKRSLKEQPLRGSASSTPMGTAQWCWKETAQIMKKHESSEIYGDPADCWIKYDDACNAKLEEAFTSGKPKYVPLPGYIVKFKNMEQIKMSTNFSRDVKRFFKASAVQAGTLLPVGNQAGTMLPADLKGEPQMVLLEGDVVQISTQRDDGWGFGTKLYHADEAASRDLVVVANGTGLDGSAADDASIFCDTGWFPLDCTRVPTAEDMEALQSNIGDSGALDPPKHWDDIKDATVAARFVLPEGDRERDAVVKAFMSTLTYPRFKLKTKVVKVERIQNFAMWQSYIVKRQTICYRETGHQAGDDDDEVQRKALKRFERSWLWHGSNAEVVDKILQQGFNRSFCGKNATRYGKGVYFARDASYSSHPVYAVPDTKGEQYMLACRVVVGEYCRGKNDALTPDIRDAKSHSLYNSTVGLLADDTLINPSIYVTYHDAQAYPEYLITFKTQEDSAFA